MEHHGVLLWYSLPASVNFASLSGFKSSLLRVDLTQFLKCTWFSKNLYCKDCSYKLSYRVLVSNMYMLHV